MNIGGLDRRIKIQSQATSVNSYGERLVAWTDYAEVWAQIERKPAAVEQNSGEQMVSVNKVVFNIRYSSTTKNINAGHRVNYDSKNYNILGAHEVGRQERIRLITEIIE
jgi:SPP1 family predicted phage head-tail adaptor